MQVNKAITLMANISLSHRSKSPEMHFSLTPKFRFFHGKLLTPPLKEGHPPLIPTPTHSCAIQSNQMLRTLKNPGCSVMQKMLYTMRTPNHIGSVVLFICLILTK